MKKYTNPLAVVAGRKLGSQEPLDDRLTWDTVAELTTAVSNLEHYSWYNGMLIYVGEKNQYYVWCSTTEAGSNANVDASANLLASNATYPGAGGPFDSTYLGLSFNFYPFKAPAHNHVEADITDLDKYSVANANATFAPISHNHDDRYYQESEVDNFLAGKAASSHTHDDRYYTETEVDGFLNLKLNTADVPADNNSTTAVRFNHYGHGNTYYNPSAPSNATSFTLETGGIVAGATSYVWSNAASEPTFTGTSVTISVTDGSFDAGNLNLIRLTYIGLDGSTHRFSREYLNSSVFSLSVPDKQLTYNSSAGILTTNKRISAVTSSGGGFSWDVSSDGYKIYHQLTENTTITLSHSNLESGDEFVIIVKQGSPTTYTCELRTTGSQEFAIPGGTWAASITLLTSAHAGEISKFVMIYDEERGRFYVDPSTSRFPA
jgi:hypothetical protein